MRRGFALAFAAAIASQVPGLTPKVRAVETKFPCENFQKNEDGSWLVLKNTFMEGPRIILQEDNTVSPGRRLVQGHDLAEEIAKACPNAPVEPPAAAAPAVAAPGVAAPAAAAPVPARPPSVSLSRYADANGNIYYNVIQLNITGNPWNQNDVAGAWLVKIAPDDSFIVATFASITPGAPAGTSLTCPGTFANQNPQPPFPWPPSPTAVAPFFPSACGSQRPGINVAPAVSGDGSTVYTVSRAHFDDLASYLLAVNTADLSPKWQASLQNRLSDGCGVLLPIAAQGVTDEPNASTKPGETAHIVTPKPDETPKV